VLLAADAPADEKYGLDRETAMTIEGTRAPDPKTADGPLMGIWLSRYEYVSSGRDGQTFSDEHYVMLIQHGANIQVRSLSFVPLCARWTIVQGPDSKRDGRALSAPLGDPSEVFGYLGSGIVSTADNGTKETAETGVGFDAQGSLSERQGSFGAQGSVVGQKIHPGTS
jgi:hypothetical protein